MSLFGDAVAVPVMAAFADVRVVSVMVVPVGLNHSNASAVAFAMIGTTVAVVVPLDTIVLVSDNVADMAIALLYVDCQPAIANMNEQ